MQQHVLYSPLKSNQFRWDSFEPNSVLGVAVNLRRSNIFANITAPVVLPDETYLRSTFSNLTQQKYD